MYTNAKTLFYFNQYFVIRLGEKLYKYNAKIANFSFLRAFVTLLFYFIQNSTKSFKGNVKKSYKYIIYVETLNQKNAIIDLFKLVQKERDEILFIVNNGIDFEGFDSLQFNNKKAFFKAILLLPKAYFISKNYCQEKAGIINKAHILVNLSLFLASEQIFSQLLQTKATQKIILTNDHNLQPLALLLSAKRNSVTSYYIQHASVSLAFPKLLPDVALLEGQQAIDVYKAIGTYAKSIKIVGVPRLDGLLAYKKEYKTTNLTIGFCLKPFYSIELITNIVHQIKKSNRVAKIVLRPHPGNSEAFYRTLESLNIEVSNAKIERPHEFIKRVDVLISGESSIVLESSLMKTKTFYIDDKIVAFDLYGFVKNGIAIFVEDWNNISHYIADDSVYNIESQYQNCQYYCGTVNTVFENKSKELILKYLFEDVR